MLVARRQLQGQDQSLMGEGWSRDGAACQFLRQARPAGRWHSVALPVGPAHPPTLLVVQLVAVQVAEPTPRSPLSTARTKPLARTSARKSCHQELRGGVAGKK